MTRKSKGKREIEESEVPDIDTIPMTNLPEKFLWMRVKSGTKIRNVLSYALKELPGHESVVWSGTGQGIGKVITCAEICKKKNPGLHQTSKLRYVKSKKADMPDTEGGSANRRVPEIHILLSKDPLDPSEPGYQSSMDQGLFPSARSHLSSGASTNGETTMKREEPSPASSKLSSVATEEFAAMGLRTGQKRSRAKDQHPRTTENPSSGNKSRRRGKN